MRRGLAVIFAALAGLVLVAVVAQFFLAGAGLFGAVSGYQSHEIVGMLIATASIVLLLLAIFGRFGRAFIIHAAALLVLLLVQIALIESDQPWLEALHPVNALLILGASAQLAQRAWARVRLPGPAAASVAERVLRERGF